MFCPFCGNEETKVIDSRLVAEGSQIKRRREYLNIVFIKINFNKQKKRLMQLMPSLGDGDFYYCRIF